MLSASVNTVDAGTRWAEAALIATSPTTSTPRPKVQSPWTVKELAFTSDGAPSGNRLSNSPTSR